MDEFCSQVVNSGVHEAIFKPLFWMFIAGFIVIPIGARLFKIPSRVLLFVNFVWFIFVGFVYLAPILDCMSR